MLTHFIRNTISKQTVKYGFAQATTATDYYRLLGVSKGATTLQIKQAFAKLNQTVSPDSDIHLFNKISEAFVILTDLKARDAYDSLLRSRKTSYMSEPSAQSVNTQNYLAKRKKDSSQEFAKKYNLDKFGRYKGGLPTKNSYIRGSSLGQTGQLFQREEFADTTEKFPDYSIVDSSVAESFKDFHQDQRKTRTSKWTWIKLQIEYDFFSITKSRYAWRAIRLLILLLFIFPTIFGRLNGYGKELKHQDELEKKRLDKNLFMEE